MIRGQHPYRDRVCWLCGLRPIFTMRLPSTPEGDLVSARTWCWECGIEKIERIKKSLERAIAEAS